MQIKPLIALVGCFICLWSVSSGLSCLAQQLAQQEDSQWVVPNPADIARKKQAQQLYELGMQLHQNGDLEGAIAAYRKSIRLEPRNKYCHHHLALALSQSGDDKGAGPEFRNALDIDYNFVQCRNNYGLSLRKVGNTQEAFMKFSQCIEIDPKYPDAYYHLGEILESRGDLDGAIKNYTMATKLNPNYVEAQRDLGLAMYKKSEDNIELALDKLLAAERLVPTNPKIHYYIGTIYCNDAKLDDAEKEFRQALMYDPKLAAAHWEFAKLRYYRGDLDRCLSEIEEAEKINPTYTDSKNYPKVDPGQMKRMTAVALEFKNRKEQAVDAWKQLASMVRDDQPILKHVKDLETQLRKEAHTHNSKKQKPITYDPAEVEAYVGKGISQYEDGDYNGARQAFERGLELNMESFEATQNLGATLEAMGDLNGALAKYQEALVLNPKYDGAYYNLAYLLEKLNLPTDAGAMYEKFHQIAGRYPYDPKHIVGLQQAEARQKAQQDQVRKRGY